jgi:hypothetical protein
MAWGTLDQRTLDELYAGADGRLYRMPRSCSSGPRLASESVVAESEEDAVGILRSQGTDVLGTRGRTNDAPVVLSQGSGTDPATAGATGTIGSAVRDGNSAVVEATTDGPMWLVLPVAYDEGWSVSVDGEPVSAEQVDFNRLGVRLEAGEHRVELSYAPPGWTAGRLVSLVALLALAGLFLKRRRSES